MSSNDPLLLLKVNLIISDITARVNTSAVEILEIVSKYEDELHLAKKEIERQRKLLEAVPKQHSTTQTLTSDVQCSELHLSASQSNKSRLSVCSLEIVYEDELCLAQEIERQRKLLEAVPKQQATTQTLTSDEQCSELHLSVCEQKSPLKQLLRDEEASQSNQSQLSVCSLTSRQFEELTKSHETGKEGYPCSCHGGDKCGRPLDAHDCVSQIDLVQIKEEEEPMSIHVGEEGFQSTLDATEDHTAISDSSQSFKSENKTLSVHLQRIQSTDDCNGDGSPSSPDQQRKMKLPSPHQHVVTSHESRGDQGRKQSLLDTTCHTRRRSKRKPACDSNADFQKLLKIESLYDCHVCGKGFKDKNKLKHHINSHNRVTCPICQINIASSGLKRHMLIHTGEKQFSCNVCEKAFYRLDHFKSHIIGHTRNKPTHTCSTCGKQFGLKRVLQRHQKIHTGEKSLLERPNKMNAGEKSLSERHKKMNTGEKSLSERRKKMNTGEKSLSERRKKIHTGEKSLSERRKKIHTGEKSPSERQKKIGNWTEPTFCPICQKYIKSHFKRHMLVHSGEKPYGCEFCGKHYRRNDHLKKHVCE